ncbi:MAG TPA: hypothetical protein VNT03_01100 [Baekduia sp.]|nr:hypothetical protein [Baekduia sp.]
MTLSSNHLPLSALLCGMAFAACAAASSPPAFAATKQPAGVGFSVAPVGRPSLRFDARPGETITGRVRVENFDRRARTVRLVGADLVTADTGGPTFPTTAPAGAGRWLTLERPLVRLPAQGSRTVPFHATMPPDATSGQHFAGIVAVDAGDAAAARAPAKKARGVSVRRLTRLALPVRLTAPGVLVSHLAMTDLAFDVDASGSSLRVGLRNDGNRIVRTTGINLKVSQGGRRLLMIDEEIQDFIPASAISFPAAWPGQLKRGTYRVTGVIRPKGAAAIRVDQDVIFGAKLAERLERKTGDRAPADDGQHGWVWIAVGCLSLGAGGVSVAYVRLRRTVTKAAAPRRPRG